MQIILASSSPRRTQILNEAHINHIIIPSKCEEIINKDDLPYQVVESLSYQKAYDVYKDNKSSLVIGADTIVVVDDIILGKPIDKEDAYLESFFNILNSAGFFGSFVKTIFASNPCTYKSKLDIISNLFKSSVFSIN